jgi:hypothetical protein
MARNRSLVAAGLTATVLMSCGAALAGPTTTIDGVTVPVGIVPGGNQLQVGLIDETLITGSHQTLEGVGFVTSIVDASSNAVWQDGTNGVRLAFVYSNFVSDTVVPPTPSTAGTVTFTGGQADFYVLPANTSISGHPGGVAGDIAAIEAGTLWLSTVGAVEDSAGSTLVSNIPANTTLNQFANASGLGFFDVAGGPAGAVFDTRTFANAFDAGGFSDLSLSSSFNTGASGDFPISGSANLKANAAPEPLSLSLLGVGLLALGIARRGSGRTR